MIEKLINEIKKTCNQGVCQPLTKMQEMAIRSTLKSELVELSAAYRIDREFEKEEGAINHMDRSAFLHLGEEIFKNDLYVRKTSMGYFDTETKIKVMAVKP